MISLYTKPDNCQNYCQTIDSLKKMYPFSRSFIFFFLFLTFFSTRRQSGRNFVATFEFLRHRQHTNDEFAHVRARSTVQQNNTIITDTTKQVIKVTKNSTVDTKKCYTNFKIS